MPAKATTLPGTHRRHKREWGLAAANAEAREFLRHADPVLRAVIDQHPDFQPRGCLTRSLHSTHLAC